MLAFFRRLLRPRRTLRISIFMMLVVVMFLLPAGCSAAKQPEPGANAAKNATLTLARDADVQRAFADGRRSLLTQNGPRDSFLQQDLDEQKALAADPRYLPDLLRLQVDVMEKLSSDPTLSDRARANNLKGFRDLARDPKYRPQLIAIMIDLMKDPQMVAALRSLMPQPGGTAPAAPGSSGAGGSSGRGAGGGAGGGTAGAASSSTGSPRERP